MPDDSTTGDAPIDWQRALRIERILLPSASTRRAQHYRHPNEGENPSAQFAHYTSAEAALSIIKNKCIWMRSTTCMSDYREMHHGYENLVKVFGEANIRKSLEEVLDPIFPGAVGEALTLFEQWWQHIPLKIPLNTYVTSVSEHSNEENAHGRLSMWRAMRSGGGRVAIVIRVPWRSNVNQALKLIFAPVSYAPLPAVQSELKAVIGQIPQEADYLRRQDRKFILGALFNMVRAHVIAAKHEGFHEEREWRVIYSPKMESSPLIKSDVEVVDGIPQIVHKIPLYGNQDGLPTDLDLPNLFERVIIGPTQYPWAMFEAFTEALKVVGVPNAAEKVSVSHIPIRT